MGRLVEKEDLPVYGEMYIACADDVNIETMKITRTVEETVRI